MDFVFREHEMKAPLKLSRTLPVEKGGVLNTRCMGRVHPSEWKKSKKVGFWSLFYYMK